MYQKRNYIEEITDAVVRGRRAGKTLAQLQAKLKAWQQRTRDPWVVKYEYE